MTTTKERTSYVWVVESVGEAGTEQDIEEFCSAAESWLVEHATGVAIEVRPARNGLSAGVFVMCGGMPFGSDLRRHETREEETEVLDLTERVWNLYCDNKLMPTKDNEE
jgi:hypothetical protein